MMFNLIILNGLLFLLMAALTWLSAKKGLALLTLCLPLYGVRLNLGGVPTTILEVMIWGVLVGWVLRQWHYHGRPVIPTVAEALSPRNPFHTYAPLITLWLAAATLAMWYSPDPLAALGIWKAYFVEPLLVFCMVVLTFKNTKERWWIPSALALSVGAMSALAIIQKMTGQFLPEPWATNLPLRVTSWYSYPNAVGLFAAPIFGLFIAWFFFRLRNVWQARKVSWPSALVLILTYGVAKLAALAVWFAQSKGAILGIIVATLAAALLVWRQYWLRVIGFSVAVTIFIFLSPVGKNIGEEIMFRSPSGVMRQVVWSESLRMLIDHPLVGAGLAGYQVALEPYHVWWRSDVSPYRLEIFLYPHNLFLNAWSELGLVGLLVFSGLILAFLYEAWPRRDKLMSLMALCAMTALLVHGLVDVPYFKNDLAILFWLIMALPLLEPRTHEAHRDKEWFNAILSGQKTIEARLHDLKRQSYNVGDLIKISNRDDERTFHVEIVELIRRPSFADLLRDLPPEQFGFRDTVHGLMSVRQYYTPEDEAMNGVVGVRIKIIN